MTVSLSSPITGTAQTGLTSPTYTVVDFTAPDVNGKSKAVTALGGTQTGVDVHSGPRPFTLSFWWPKIWKLLGFPDRNGNVRSEGFNVVKLVTRKGVTPFLNMPSRTMVITTSVEVPVGAEAADAANVRAALSAHIGGLSQVSSGFGDTAVTGLP